MKALSFIVVLGLITSSIALAVEPDQLAQRTVNIITGKLSLGSAETEQIRSILSDHITAHGEKAGKEGNVPQSRGETPRAIEREVKKQIVEVLTDEQRELLKESKIRLLPHPRLMELNAGLDLSLDQIDQIEVILEKNKPAKGKRGKKEDGESQQNREEKKLAKDGQDAEIVNILTEPQKELFLQMKKERKEQKGQRQPPPGKEKKS